MEIVRFYLELQNHARLSVNHDQQRQHSPAFFEISDIFFFSILVSLKIFLGKGVNRVHVSKASVFVDKASNSFLQLHQY